jgi:hypothetical protein
MPIWPALSRNAISFSPSSISRSGSPSATSSADRQAGIQYCRSSVPIGVPGPIRVRNSFSAAVVIGAPSGHADCRRKFRASAREAAAALRHDYQAVHRLLSACYRPR